MRYKNHFCNQENTASTGMEYGNHLLCGVMDMEGRVELDPLVK